MSGNARFHDKLHRANHHTLSTGGLLDSAYDPIASPEHPFRGNFILSGGLSALGNLTAGDVYAKNTDVNDLNVRGNAAIAGTTTTKNQVIEGNIKLAGQNFGASCIYARTISVRPEAFTLTLSYENGVYIKDNLNAYGYVLANDISANGVFYGRLPTVGGFSPNTWDIASCYSTVRTVSTSWSQATTWVNSNSSSMVVDNLLVTGNLTALGSTTLVNLTTNTSDSLSVVNVGLAVPAIYAEIVTANQPVLSLKQQGTGHILSAYGDKSTFVINNSGWIGIGGDPITQLDIYPLSSSIDGGNIKLRGSTNSNKDFGISVRNSDLKISHTPKASNVKTTAVTITSAGQLAINTDNTNGSAGAPISQDAKLIVNGRIYLSGGTPVGVYEPYISTVITNAQYENIYKIDNSPAEGAVTRIYNLSGSADAPLSGFSKDVKYSAPEHYPGYAMRVFPYIGGTLGAGYGALGGGGVANISLGYEGIQSTTNLRGLILFNTLCGSQTDSVAINSERMRITPEGNVGIGTRTPGDGFPNNTGVPKYRLHVLGDNDKDINFMTNGAMGVYNREVANRSYGFLSVSQQYTLLGSNLRLSGEMTGTSLPVYKKGTNERAGAGILTFNANGPGVIPTTKFVYSADTDDDSYTVNESMVISGTTVGIGTNNPDSQLHILAPGGRHCHLTLEADSANSNENEDVHPGIIFKQDGGRSFGYLGYLGENQLLAGEHNQLQIRSAHGIILATGGDGAKTNYNYNKNNQTEAYYLSANPRFFISPGGNIGVNTLFPGDNYQLDVNGNMNVSGQLTGATINDIYSKINNASNTGNTIGTNFNTLSTNFNTLSTNVNTLSTNFNTLSTNFNTLSTNFNTLSTNVNTLSTNFNTLSTNFNTLSTNVNTLSTNVNTLSTNFNTLSTNFNTLSTNFNTLSTNFNTLSTNFNTLSTNFNTLSTNVNTLSTNFNTLSTNVNTLSTNVNTLSTNVNTLSGYLNTFKVESTQIGAPTNGVIANDQYLKISINGATKYIRLWDALS